MAAQTGETLFAGENADLSDRFGTRMQEYLKSGEEEQEEAPIPEEEPVPEEEPAATEEQEA